MYMGAGADPGLMKGEGGGGGGGKVMIGITQYNM